MEEHIDFYFNENGFMVLTEKFLAERGYCCGNGCTHCPYGHINVPSGNKKTQTQIDIEIQQSSTGNEKAKN